MIRYWWLFLCFPLLASCVKQRDLSQNILFAHIATAPKSLHITNDQTAVKTFVFSILQKTLYTIDLKTQDIVPILLTQMPIISNNNLSYTFTLRPDVTWDDKTPLTAKDVFFTIKLNMCSLTNNSNIRGTFTNAIDSVALHHEDPLKFTVVMQEDNILNPSLFSDLIIMQEVKWDPKSVLKALNFNQIKNPNHNYSEKEKDWFQKFNDPAVGSDVNNINGLGPYKAIEWNEQSIICVRKNNWWGAKDSNLYNAQDPDKIIFKIIPNIDAAIGALRRGEIDFTHKMGAGSLVKLQKSNAFNKHYQYQEVGQYAFSFIGWNTKPDGIKHAKLFTDRKVRLALAHACPTDEIIEVFLNGKGVRQNSYILPLKSYYNDTLPTIRLDLDKASALLDEAGWIDSDGDHIRDKIIDGKKVPFSFKMCFIKGGSFGEMVSMVAYEMKKIGIEMIPDPMNQGNLINNLVSHTYDAVYVSLIGDAKYDDPTQLWKTESWANHGFNFTGFGNAETDSLIDVINSRTSHEAYTEEIKKFQAILYKEQPFVFMYQQNKQIILHKRFDHHGFYPEKPGAIINAFKLNGAYHKSIDG